MRRPRGPAQIFAGTRSVRLDPLHDGVGEDQLQRGDALHEIAHIIVDRVGDDVLGRADLHDPPVLHDRDPAADTDRLVEIVGDEHRGLGQLGRQRHELLLKLPPDQRVQGGKRLVHQQDLGVRSERPGEADPLLHAVRQFARKAVLVTVQIDEAEAALGDLPPRRFRLALHLEREGDVVPDRAVRKQRHVLENHADLGGAQLPQLAFSERQHIPSEHFDAAGSRLDQPVDMTNHRRLSRARQSHDAKDFAPRNVEGAIRDADHASELFEHLRLGEAVLRDGLHRFPGARAEDLPHAVQSDDRFTQSGSLRCGRIAARRGAAGPAGRQAFRSFAFAGFAGEMMYSRS